VGSNSNGRRRTLLLLGVVAVALATLLFFVTSEPARESRPALPAARAVPTRASDAEDTALDVADRSEPVFAVPAAERVPIDAPQPLLELFAAGHTFFWTDLSHVDFDGPDVRALAYAVRALRVEASELRKLGASLSDDDPRKPAVLLSFAWARNVSSDDQRWLASHALAPGAFDAKLSNPVEAAHAFAAIQALRLAGANDGLEEIVFEVASRAGGARALCAGFVRLPGVTNVALALVLDGVRSVDSARWGPLLDAALKSDRRSPLTQQLWATAVRAGGHSWEGRALAEAGKENGAARMAIEQSRSEPSTPDLIALVEQRKRSVYGNWLAQSAAIGLASIGSPQSLATLERWLDDPVLRDDAQRALERGLSPRNAGDCLRLLTKHGDLSWHLGQARERIERELELRTFPIVERDAIRGSLRAELERGELGDDERIAALEMLATVATADDRALLEPHARDAQLSSKFHARVRRLQ
jgi:hypothetical protein